MKTILVPCRNNSSFMRRATIRAAGASLGIGLLMTSRLTQATSTDSSAVNGETVFDARVLEARGFSAEIATFFSRRARFLPGMHKVKVAVNALPSRELAVRFDGEGDPCFDVTLLQQLGLRVSEDIAVDTCADVDKAYPAIRIVLRPGQSEMELTVPEDAFDAAVRPSAHMRGGAAFILNYDAFVWRSRGVAASSGYTQLWVEPGVNLRNWVLRSTGTFTRNQRGTDYRHHAAYIQRGLERTDSLLQAGQLLSASELFGGIPFMGTQLFSDSARSQSVALAVPIQGMVESNAVVEVRQYGRLVYRTVVPPGLYSLSHIDALAAGADIDVRVIEDSGRIQQFSLPAPLSSATGESPATYHFGIGRYSSYGTQTRGREPWLAYGSYAINFSTRYRVSGGALVSARHQAGSAQVLATRDASWVSAALRITRSRKRGLGHELQLQASTILGAGLSAGVSWQSRDRNFSAIEDTVYRSQEQTYVSSFQRSLSASLSWSSLRWGAYSYSASGSDRRNVSHGFTAGRKFGRLHSRIQFQIGGAGQNAVYINLNMPLGDADMGLRVQRWNTGQHSVAGTYQGKVSRDASYKINAETSGDARRLGGSVQVNTSYAQLLGAASTSGRALSSLHLSASGGMVLTESGSFAMSSSRVGDTFALIRVPRVAGARMYGTGGSAKTSAWGSAVVPSISPYQDVRIQLDGKSLPTNYRFGSTALNLNLARGTVATQAFTSTEIRQLLVRVSHADGSPAKVGSAVFDEQRDFLGTVIGNGNMVLVNDDIGKTIYLETGMQRCRVDYDIPGHFDPKRPYEEVEATCT